MTDDAQYSVGFGYEPTPRKELSKLDRQVARRIARAITALGASPRPASNPKMSIIFRVLRLSARALPLIVLRTRVPGFPTSPEVRKPDMRRDLSVAVQGVTGAGPGDASRPAGPDPAGADAPRPKRWACASYTDGNSRGNSLVCDLRRRLTADWGDRPAERSPAMIRVLTADEPLGLQANLTSDEQIEVSPHYPPCMMSCTAPAGATDTTSDCAEVQRAFPPCTSAFRSGPRRLQRAERGSVGMLWVVMEGSPGGRAAAGAASSARQRTALLRLHMAPSLTTGCCWLVLAALSGCNED